MQQNVAVANTVHGTVVMLIHVALKAKPIIMWYNNNDTKKDIHTWEIETHIYENYILFLSRVQPIKSSNYQGGNILFTEDFSTISTNLRKFFWIYVLLELKKTTQSTQIDI